MEGAEGKHEGSHKILTLLRRTSPFAFSSTIPSSFKFVSEIESDQEGVPRAFLVNLCIFELFSLSIRAEELVSVQGSTNSDPLVFPCAISYNFKKCESPGWPVFFHRSTDFFAYPGGSEVSVEQQTTTKVHVHRFFITPFRHSL